MREQNQLCGDGSPQIIPTVCATFKLPRSMKYWDGLCGTQVTVDREPPTRTAIRIRKFLKWALSPVSSRRFAPMWLKTAFGTQFYSILWEKGFTCNLELHATGWHGTWTSPVYRPSSWTGSTGIAQSHGSRLTIGLFSSPTFPSTSSLPLKASTITTPWSASSGPNTTQRVSTGAEKMPSLFPRIFRG